MLNVAQGTTNGALHHEATNAAGLVAANDGVLHCVRDGIDHGVHGRYVGARHVSLPWVNSGENSGKNSGESLLPSSFLQELDDFSWSLFYSQLESLCSQEPRALRSVWRARVSDNVLWDEWK